MEVFINSYYTYIIEDMISEIKTSIPGKRRWRTLNDGTIDYSITERSTFPIWSKFFYESTPAKLTQYYKYHSKIKNYEHGYFNGNTRELLTILNNALTGKAPKTKRGRCAFDIMLKNKLEEIKDFEEQNNCSYFWILEN